jgi:predicted RNase H-like nuclease
MLFTDSVFIGIEFSSHRKSLTYAVIDKGLNLLALTHGNLLEVTAYMQGQSSTTVAVNAPSGLKRVQGRETNKQLSKPGFRSAEQDLRERGILVAGTPAAMEDCHAWVQDGFTLYRKLEKAGFKKYPTETEATHQILETNPYAAFCVIADVVLQTKPSLEGKIQRQLLLYEAGLRITDPMDFFEEITRHKMLKGIWPHELLYSHEQLNALVAAYTAWLAVHKPDQISMIGDPREGVIVLPEKNLKEKY